MKCNRCGSDLINIQVVEERKKKKKSIFYWILIGWWLEIIMWIFLTIPWLIIKLVKPTKYNYRNKTMAVCQSCGNTWEL